LDYGPDKIVYPNGAYILRQPQDSVKIPGCKFSINGTSSKLYINLGRSIYHRQMDGLLKKD